MLNLFNQSFQGETGIDDTLCQSLQGETIQFKPYTHRYQTPFESSGSTEPYWYSIKMASAHIIVMASYSAYGMDSWCFKLIAILKQIQVENRKL